MLLVLHLQQLVFYHSDEWILRVCGLLSQNDQFYNRRREDCQGFPGGSDSKESACSVGDLGFSPWVRKIPWRRKWQPTPVLLPGEFHGQRTLAGLQFIGS